ncbi:MFS transporter [Polymorphospora sp. NPDC050346]|uniref:MFS transporter n=1 Tax=Polymorphospora sp. NPDC050346 TaxID=3155780 RepID=UPI0033EC3654
MSAPEYPAPVQPLVVRPLWSLAGPTLGALLSAGLLTAPIGPWGSTIQRELGLSTATMAVTLIAPYVAAMAAMGVPGYLLGRRWPTATGVSALLLLIVGSLMCSLAPGAAPMAVGRVVLGLGAGTVIGVLLAVSRQLNRWRSQAQLVLGLTLGAALLLGPVVSGVVTRTMTWRMVFLVDLPVAGLALVVTAASGIAMWVMRASQPSPQPAPAAVRPSGTRLGGPTR